MKDLKQLPERLPEPHPPNKTKSETIDIVEYMLVDDKAIRVSIKETMGIQNTLEVYIWYYVDSVLFSLIVWVFKIFVWSYHGGRSTEPAFLDT